MAVKFKIKKGDTVFCISGKDKGKKGTVLKVDRKENRVFVSGINIVKKAQKPSQANPSGGIISMEKSIHCSNVMIADPKVDLPVKIGYKVLDSGEKVRVSRKTGEIING